MDRDERDVTGGGIEGSIGSRADYREALGAYVPEDVQEKLLQARDEIVASVRVYVRAHPFAALGAAVFAGFVVGRILAKR